MKKVILEAEKRDIVGKNSTYKLRQEGKIPCIIYSKGEAGINIQIERRNAASIINNPSTANAIIDIKTGDFTKQVIIKEYQTDPVTSRLLHIDFFEVDMNKEIELQIPINLTGTAIGLSEGGLLEQIIRDVSISCLPANIPTSIDLDITDLSLGQSLHLSDIEFPEGVELLDDESRTVITISEPSREELPEEEVEGEELEGEKGAEGEETGDTAATGADEESSKGKE